MQNKIKDLEEKLLRKEQECERLKYDNDYQVAALETTIDNLKAELEQEQTLKEMYFTYYKAKHGDIEGKFFRYRQALTEIKEIVGIGLVDGLQPEEYQKFLKILQAQILQLISEVENDRQS